jgi:hypothetical protein
MHEFWNAPYNLRDLVSVAIDIVALVFLWYVGRKNTRLEGELYSAEDKFASADEKIEALESPIEVESYVADEKDYTGYVLSGGTGDIARYQLSRIGCELLPLENVVFFSFDEADENGPAKASIDYILPGGNPNLSEAQKRVRLSGYEAVCAKAWFEKRMKCLAGEDAKPSLVEMGVDIASVEEQGRSI